MKILIHLFIGLFTILLSIGAYQTNLHLLAVLTLLTGLLWSLTIKKKWIALSSILFTIAYFLIIASGALGTEFIWLFAATFFATSAWYGNRKVQYIIPVKDVTDRNSICGPYFMRWLMLWMAVAVMLGVFQSIQLAYGLFFIVFLVIVLSVLLMRFESTAEK